MRWRKPRHVGTSNNIVFHYRYNEIATTSHLESMNRLSSQLIVFTESRCLMWDSMFSTRSESSDSDSSFDDSRDLMEVDDEPAVAKERDGSG